MNRLTESTNSSSFFSKIGSASAEGASVRISVKFDNELRRIPKERTDDSQTQLIRCLQDAEFLRTGQ